MPLQRYTSPHPKVNSFFDIVIYSTFLKSDSCAVPIRGYTPNSNFIPLTHSLTRHSNPHLTLIVVAAVDTVDFIYWCRPLHYLGGPQGSWQRIDSGLIVNSTVRIDYIKVWIESSEFDPEIDELGMIENIYDKSIFGFKSDGGNEIIIKGLGDAVETSSDDWTKSIRYAGYRMPLLSNEETANLCTDYVGKHTRTIKMQIYDAQGGSSSVYEKSLEVITKTRTPKLLTPPNPNTYIILNE